LLHSLQFPIDLGTQ